MKIYITIVLALAIVRFLNQEYLQPENKRSVKSFIGMTSSIIIEIIAIICLWKL